MPTPAAPAVQTVHGDPVTIIGGPHMDLLIPGSVADRLVTIRYADGRVGRAQVSMLRAVGETGLDAAIAAAPPYRGRAAS